ncbi:MAG: AAA family ATPase [Ardenticatenales bacterium]|nr:AAA family ATPase [Ardenticatenales bacterium]
MRLIHLRIPKYRNLVSFEINFDSSESTTVLLGRNGTGKSNLIEAIVEIFRELEVGQATAFYYDIEYSCYGHSIHVECDPARPSRRLAIEVDGSKMSAARFRDQVHVLLPQHVFAYYSGWGSRLEKQFEPPTRRRYRALLRNEDDDAPLRRFFFCRKEYSQLALLAFFLTDDGKAQKFLGERLGIDAFESALFVLKKPWWGNHRGVRPGVDTEEQLWNATGAFLPFVRRLWDVALAPLQRTEDVERPIPRDTERTERKYLFVKDEARLKALRAPFEGVKSLFANLEALYLCDLIDEVRILVRMKNGARVRFTQLSEGEQQLLTVLGLLLFTQDDEVLYLLDEPDTHLNPIWTYDFLKLLKQNIRAEMGQLIISTHNPLMIGSLHKNQVRVLTESEGQVVASEPDFDPIGIGVEGLLKSELYGLRSTLAWEVLKKLDRHYFLLGKVDKSDEEQAELMRLAADLNDMGVSRTHPNPYFESFANAMARRRSPSSAGTLSKVEIDAQVELADAVLAEVMAEEQSDAGGRS